MNDNLAANTLSGRIFDKFSDPKSNIFGQKKAIEFMREAIKMAKNSREKIIFSKALQFISGRIEWRLIDNRKELAANNKAQIENLIRKFFDIADIKNADDYPDSKFYPIYILKNQGR